MSKIMRRLYAEAREAAANAKERQPRATETAAKRGILEVLIDVGAVVPNPTGSPPSSIDWWRAQYEKAGRAAAFKAAEDAKERQVRHSEIAASNPTISSPWIIEWVSGHTARKG